MLDSNKFFEIFPKDVYELCVSISRQGFCLTLVGGAVRDFLKDGILSKDLDFEIKHLFEYDEQRWERMLMRLFDNLEKEFSINVEAKGLNVFSINMGDHELEFSSPRLEEFNENDTSHKNFIPKFISNLDSKKAYGRRDFSLNAIGIFFGVSGAHDEFTIVDPFDGTVALRNETLSHINDDFYKDPVRFLRAIRFRNRFDFKLDDKLISGLSRFNLSEVSAYYVRSEFEKVGRYNYFKELFSLSNEYKIKLSTGLENIKFLGHINPSHSLSKLDKGTLFEWIGTHYELSDEQKLDCYKYFSLSIKLGEKLSRLTHLYKELDENSIESYVEFFTLFYSLNSFSFSNTSWIKNSELWQSELSKFRPSDKSSAKNERKIYLENLTKKIMSVNNS